MRKIRVTEKNMMAVMGKINKFLSHPTERIDSSGEPVPSNAICSEHSYRIKCKTWNQAMEDDKEIMQDAYQANRLFIEDVLLQIGDSCSANGCPIEVGSVITISGDRLTIKHNDATQRFWDAENRRVGRQELFGKPTTTVFVHKANGNGNDAIEILKRELATAAGAQYDEALCYGEQDIDGSYETYKSAVTMLYSATLQLITSPENDFVWEDCVYREQLDDNYFVDIIINYDKARNREEGAITYMYDNIEYKTIALVAQDVAYDVENAEEPIYGEFSC